MKRIAKQYQLELLALAAGLLTVLLVLCMAKGVR